MSCRRWMHAVQAEPQSFWETSQCNLSQSDFTRGAPYEATVDARSNGRSLPSRAGGCCLAGSRWGLPRFVVLVVAGMAGFHCGDGGRRALAMAGRNSVGGGICGRLTLHLGLRLGGRGYACPRRSAEKIGGGRVLSTRT